MCEKISEYEKSDIGLVRNQRVTLKAYNPRWKRVFSDEAQLIYSKLGIESFYLHHIGSTSIPNIKAKPVLDILGVVGSLDELDQKQHVFESLGYEYKDEYGIAGRRYCVLYNSDKTKGYVHLHVFEKGHVEVERHLIFRDFLRENEKLAKEYEAVKIDLAEVQKVERSEYSPAKSDCIQSIMKEAYANKKTQEKILVVVGAAEGHGNTLLTVQKKFESQDVEVIDLCKNPVAEFSYKGTVEDHFYQIIEKMIEADRVVFATPVYWYAMSGVMKDFFDRFSNLMSGKYKELGESLYGKKVELLSTGYDLEAPIGFEVPFVSTSYYFGMDYMGFTYESVR